MTDFAQDGILLQVGMGGCIGLFGARSLIPPTACPCGNLHGGIGVCCGPQAL